MQKPTHVTPPQPQVAAAPTALPRALLITAGVLFVAITLTMVMKFLHHDYKDADVWYDAGRRVLEGRSLLRLPHYRYPPAFAVLVSPLCVLPYPVYFFVWYLLNVALLPISVWLSLRLAWPREEPCPSRLLWLPALLTIVYAADNWFLGQTNVLMMALLYWVLWDLGRGRETRAGLVLGASIAMKVFTFPLLAYLLYRRRWATLGAVFVSLGFFLLLLPAPVRGFQRNLHEVIDWGDRVVEPYLTEGKAGDWGQHALDFGDQSLQAALNRLLAPVNAGVLARHGDSFYVNLAHLTPSQVNLVVVAAFLALVGVFLWASGRRRPAAPEQFAAEASLATIGLLLVSGLAWTYFFVMLLLPEAVAVALLSRQPAVGSRTRQVLVAALWLQGLAVISLTNAYARALGSVCWASVALYVALAAACRELRRAKAT